MAQTRRYYVRVPEIEIIIPELEIEVEEILPNDQLVTEVEDEAEEEDS